MTGRIKLYTDEQISHAVIVGLRQRGLDVLSTADAAMLGAADEAQLALAAGQDRVLLTQDTDFLRLNARRVPHRGIIYARQGMAIGEIIREVVLIYQDTDPAAMANSVKYL